MTDSPILKPEPTPRSLTAADLLARIKAKHPKNPTNDIDRIHCPFCGSEKPYLIIVHKRVFCESCEAHGPIGSDDADAVRRWNQRFVAPVASDFRDRKSETVKTQHPAWQQYWAAEREWRRLNDEATKAHRRMEDAADELVQAGEMQRD